jgi:lambda family phage portal protein
VKKALKAFTARSGSPREDIDWNNATLRQRGRILYMASPVATSAIKTTRTNVVGVGLKLQSRVNRKVLGLTPEAAKEWQTQTEAEFELWASKKQACDATGVNNFYGLQQLALLSWLMSGDVFALYKQYDRTRTEPYALRIHLIEADRVSTPSGTGLSVASNFTESRLENGNMVDDGVEVDQQGRIVAYYIRNTYPYEPSIRKTDWQRVEAYGQRTGLPNILQIMDSERPDQYRGVTYLAQVIEPLLQIRRYTESELMAALVQSFFSAWIKTNTDTAEFPLSSAAKTAEGDDFTASVPGGGDDTDSEYVMGPGTVTHLKPDEEITFGNPNVPTSGFKDFVHTISGLVGAALEIPKEILLQEFGQSYSASRAALLMAWSAFKMRRTWFVDDFCQPSYEVWLAEAIALGRIRAPGFFSDPLIRAAWCGATWIGPVQGILDPVKETKAAVTVLGKGWKTNEQVTIEMGGGNWEDNVEQLARENELLNAAGGNTSGADDKDDEDDDDDEGGNKDA